MQKRWGTSRDYTEEQLQCLLLIVADFHPRAVSFLFCNHVIGCLKEFGTPALR